MTPTTSFDRVDHKLRRLRAIESGYRHWIKRAQEEMRDATIDRERAQKRFEKIKAKYTHKIDKLQPKIRSLTLRRAELKG